MTFIVFIITLNLSSKENVTFLDLIMKGYLKGYLTTDLHIKDTDQHQ